MSINANVWNAMTEGQKIVAAYKMGTIDGDDALACSIDVRMAIAADFVAKLQAEKKAIAAELEDMKRIMREHGIG